MNHKENICLFVFFSSIVIITGMLSAHTGNSEDDSNSKESLVIGPKAWALGCSAMLTERNHDRHDLLGMGLRTKRNIKKRRKFLRTIGWNIENRSDLLENLRWIDTGGNRIKFIALGKYVTSLSEQAYKAFLQDNKNDVELLNKIKIAKKYYQELDEKNLLGWDYGRYICLCRWGYMAGYVSEEEAWKRIMPVARELQRKFDSWEDLGRNYLIGRQFWSHKNTLRSGYLFEDSYQRLIDMPSSPWNKYVWDMDLQDEDSISEPNEPSVDEQSNSK